MEIRAATTAGPVESAPPPCEPEARLNGFARKRGLLPLARWLRHELPREYHFQRFRLRFGRVLEPRTPRSTRSRTALLVSGPHTSLPVDLWLIKSLELAGYSTVVLALGARHWDRYFRLAGASEVHTWRDFSTGRDYLEEAVARIDGSPTLESIAQFEYAGARVGRIASSTALRELRLGTFQLDSSQAHRWHLERRLAQSMSFADAARLLLAKTAPDLAVFSDMMYLQRGELFDLCLQDRIRVLVWHPAHRSNHLILKMYGPEDRDEHPVSLSPSSWRQLREMSWTEAHRAELRGELERAYARGDWYGESGTQFSKSHVGRAEIEERLGLDTRRKNAFIFAHISWDAPLAWGENLFENYEHWLVETVRAACDNDKVNWVVKIHPANVGKRLKERYSGEPAELVALRRQVPDLPPHVVLLPAESEISTYALFDLMDYCLTVRGTIGIEAASFGIPVLTGGSGRYDRRGFTVDSASRDEYLGRIRSIQGIPRLSAQARELAERFAYGIFVLRPFPLESISLEFDEACGAQANFTRSRINAASAQQWNGARDLSRMASWLRSPLDADPPLRVQAMPGAGN